MAVPNSSGTSTPRFKTPRDATDCHVQIYDARFELAWRALGATLQATVTDYRLLQERLGTTRAVVVQPAAYGTDNEVTMDAVAQLGLERARGVAVLHPSAREEKLRAMHERGIRGLRFSQHDARTAVTTAEMIEPLARRAAALGWHVQLHLRGAQIVEMEELLGRLPCPVVIDHMARIPQPLATEHPAMAVVRRLLDAGNTWVKLSGAYLDTQTGAPRYADVKPVAKALVQHAPERLLWGSEWPHPTQRDTKPDDAVLLDLLQEWVPDEPTRRRILVDNPAKLYGFLQT